MNNRQVFLITAAIGLLPIAFSYGVVPQKSLRYLFDISVQDPNGAHIFRAIMGLYLSFVLFWIVGVFQVQIRQAAIYSLIVFMLGLVVGRVLSLIIDGMPHWLLFIYLVLELGFGLVGVFLLKQPD